MGVVDAQISNSYGNFQQWFCRCCWCGLWPAVSARYSVCSVWSLTIEPLALEKIVVDTMVFHMVVWVSSPDCGGSSLFLELCDRTLISPSEIAIYRDPHRSRVGC